MPRPPIPKRVGPTTNLMTSRFQQSGMMDPGVHHERETQPVPDYGPAVSRFFKGVWTKFRGQQPDTGATQREIEKQKGINEGTRYMKKMGYFK